MLKQTLLTLTLLAALATQAQTQYQGTSSNSKLDNVLTHNGTVPLSADLPAGGNKITNLGNGTDPGDALNLSTADNRFVNTDATGKLVDDLDVDGYPIHNVGVLETSVIQSQDGRAFDFAATGPIIGGGLAAGESTVVAQGDYIYVAGTQWRTTYRANERYLYISAGVAQGVWEYADYGTVAVADVPYTGAVVGEHYVAVDQRGAGFSGSLGSPAIGTCHHAATLQTDAITIAYRVMCAPYAPMFGGWQSALHATGMLAGMSPDRHYYETSTIGKSAASWMYVPQLLPHNNVVEMLIAFVPLQDNQTSSSLRFDNTTSAWSLVLSAPGTITIH